MPQGILHLGKKLLQWSMWIPKRYLKGSGLVQVNPIRLTTLTFTYITRTNHAFTSALQKSILKTAQKNEQRRILSLSSHIWEIWSSLWRELRFMRLVGKHTVVETLQWNHFSFPRVREQKNKNNNNEKGKGKRNGCLKTCSHTRSPRHTTGQVTGAEFQIKQIQK